MFRGSLIGVCVGVVAIVAGIDTAADQVSPPSITVRVGHALNLGWVVLGCGPGKGVFVQIFAVPLVCNPVTTAVLTGLAEAAVGATVAIPVLVEVPENAPDIHVGVVTIRAGVDS